MHKKWTKCKIRRVLSDLDFFCCSNGILPGIESIFSIVPIRKCRRTSVLVHGTKWCTIRRFYAVGSISGISVHVVAHSQYVCMYMYYPIMRMHDIPIGAGVTLLVWLFENVRQAMEKVNLAA